MDMKNRFAGALMGLAIGDAYGTTFKQRNKHTISTREICVDDFVGGGPFNLMKGMFTDSTTLALIISECLLDFSFDPKIVKADDREMMTRIQNLFANDSDLDEMNELNSCIRGKIIQKKLFEWYDKGHFSSNGLCFHIERTTKEFIVKNHKLKRSFCNNFDLSDNSGRSCVLTRVAPVVLYFYGVYLKKCKENKIKSDYENAIVIHRIIQESGFSSMLTHPSQIAIDCNRYMAALIIGTLQNATKEELLQPMFLPKYLPEDYWEKFPLQEEVLKVVRDCSYKDTAKNSFRNSRSCLIALESALSAFYRSESYIHGLVEIVSLGDESDSVGAIYGQLAGCFYGLSAIPKQLIRNCTYSCLIDLMAEEFIHGPNSYRENTFVYEKIMRLFIYMEDLYSILLDKIRPSAKQFRSIDEFENSVNLFHKEVLEYIQDVVNKDYEGTELDHKRFKQLGKVLLVEFIKRCNEYVKEPLRAQIEKMKALMKEPVLVD